MKKVKLLVSALLLTITTIKAQLPAEVLVGYWHNWETLRITDVNDSYNVICLSFFEADKNGAQDDNSVNDLEFTPTLNKTTIKNDIATVQGEGKIVLMSIGGANGSFKLNNLTEKNTFVTKTKAIIQEYGVDGIDIDIERSIYITPSTNQTVTNPVNHIQYLVDACKELKTWYQTQYNKDMILTTAPEVSYTTGGLSPWNANNGALIPFLELLKDDLDLVMVQFYNAGGNYAIPGWPSTNTEYQVGTTDFIITQTEALIEGFTMNTGTGSRRTSGTFSGIPASKIAIALPSGTCAAGSGYVSPTNIKAAVNYILGNGSKPGNYTLSQSYPGLRGLMTWSINNDANPSCSGTYTFASAFDDIYDNHDNSNSVITGGKSINKTINFYPNPATKEVIITGKELINKTLSITDINGKIVQTTLISTENQSIELNNLTKGVYFLKADNYVGKVILK